MIWGKVIGALAGLALGHSPLGMIAGGAAGHWVDSWWARRFPDPETQRRGQAFLTGVTCLSAKLSKSDGPVTRGEVDCFKAQFRFAAEQKSLVARLYDEARQDPRGYEPYARLLAENFSGESFLLAEIFGALYRIAIVDGGPNAAEQAFLENVAAIFGLAYQGFHAERPRPRVGDDPYLALGVKRSDTMAEIKAAWRRLSREHHPDTLIAKGVPDDYVALASKKMAVINAAYDQIRNERGES